VYKFSLSLEKPGCRESSELQSSRIGIFNRKFEYSTNRGAWEFSNDEKMVSPSAGG